MKLTCTSQIYTMLYVKQIPIKKRVGKTTCEERGEQSFLKRFWLCWLSSTIVCIKIENME